MTLQRLYNIAQTGQTAEPTAVDNIMAQYQPKKQEGGFWNGFKNFAGSDVGRMLIGGLGTAAAVGLSGGSGKDALRYGLMGAGSTMQSIDSRNRYRDKLMKEQQDRADRMAEAEKLRQHQLTMQANNIQANKDAADLEFERRMAAIREGRDYAEQQNANEIAKTDAYIDSLPYSAEQKQIMKVQARGFTAPATISPISSLTDEYLNPNTTEERRSEILPLIQGYHQRANTISSFTPKEKVGIVDLMKSVKHAKDSGASPETLTQMVKGYGYDIDFTGNTIFDVFDRIRENPKYNHMTDDEIWNALDVQTLSGQLALHQGKRGIDNVYDTALANTKAENDMRVAEFKNGLPTETQRNITAQSQATGIPESVLYKALYDKQKADIEKVMAQIGDIYAGTTGKNIANQFIGAEKQAGINQTIANTDKTRAEIPFVGQTSEMKNYNFLQKNPDAVNSPVFAKEGNTTNIYAGQNQDEFGKQLAKNQANEYNEYQKAGRDADMQLYTLNNMLSAIKNPNVYQGTAGGLVNTFKTALSSAGVDVAGMDDAAIINSGKSQLMGALRKDLMPGAMSDRDIGFLVNMVPGLGKTREQNEAIINMFAKVYQRQAEASKFVTDYVAEHGMWDVHGQRALMKLTNRPIFTDEERAAAMGQPVYRIMLAPNGKKVKVHLSEVDNAIKNGGKIIQ